MLGRLFNSKSSSNLSDISATTLSTSSTSSYHTSPSSSITSPVLPKFDTSRSDNYCDAYTRTLLYGTPNQSIVTPFDNSAFRIIIIQDGSIRSKNALYDSALPYQQQQQQQQQQQLLQLPNNSQQQTQQSSQYNQPTHKLDNAKYHNLLELSDYMFGCGVPITELSISTKIHSLPSLPKTSSSVLITRLFTVNSKFSISTAPEKFDEDWTPKSSLPLDHYNATKDLTRFGIGFIIPLESSNIDSLIANNWEEYINFIAIFQSVIISKLKLQCAINPNICMSLHKNRKNTINKRLSFPSYVLQNDFELQHHLNNFIKLSHSLYHIPRLLVGVKRSDASLFNWCHHLAAWLEFKDGKNLMALSRLEFLASLFLILIPLRRQLLTNKPCDKTKKITRVVIMTGNPVVVQKLIFIIAGVLADDVLLVNTAQYKPTETTAPIRSISISKPRKSSNGGSSSSATPSLVSSFSKGWEIPKNTPSIPTNTVTAKPVNFSPSKISDTSSTSLQYLSSSLSSSYTSTSWKQQVPFFEKWRSDLGSANTGSNGSNGSTFDSFSKISHQKKLSNYRTPSPALEYEEYPWSNANTMHSFQPSKLTRTQSSFDLSVLANNGNSRYNVNTLQHVERTPTTIKGSIDLDAFYERECRSIMTSTPSFEVLEENGEEYDKNVVLETTSLDGYTLLEEFQDLLEEKNKSIDVHLKPLVGYVDEFHPEFTLQACPIKVGLDQEIINTMKNDLIDHSFVKSPVPRTVSRTIFVSLAAREIKEFELKTMGTNASLSTSPIPNAPTMNDGITVKKLFSPRKREIDNSKVTKIDNLLDMIIDVAKSISDDERSSNVSSSNITITDQDNSDLSKFEKIRELLDEMSLVV